MECFEKFNELLWMVTDEPPNEWCCWLQSNLAPAISRFPWFNGARDDHGVLESDVPGEGKVIPAEEMARQFGNGVNKGHDFRDLTGRWRLDTREAIQLLSAFQKQRFERSLPHSMAKFQHERPKPGVCRVPHVEDRSHTERSKAPCLDFNGIARELPIFWLWLRQDGEQSGRGRCVWIGGDSGAFS